MEHSDLICSLIAEKMRFKGKVTSHTSLSELGLDAMDLVSLMVLIEDQTGFTFDDEQMLSFCCVQDIINAILIQ